MRRDRDDNFGDAQLLIANALVDLNDSGIVGAAPVTAWNNSGTGGSGYDLDVVFGTAANLTADTQLGNTVVSSTGSVGIETTAGQTIAQPSTVFLVGAITNTPAANSMFFSSRASAVDISEMYSRNASADRFSIEAGAELTLSEAFDNDPHVFTAIFNGASSSLMVSGVGTATGNAGAADWDYATLFDDLNAGNSIVGYIARFLVFGYLLPQRDIDTLTAYLKFTYPGTI